MVSRTILRQGQWSSSTVTGQWINTDGSKSYLVSARQSSSLTHQSRFCQRRNSSFKAITSTGVETSAAFNARMKHASVISPSMSLPSPPFLSNGPYSSTSSPLTSSPFDSSWKAPELQLDTSCGLWRVYVENEK